MTSISIPDFVGIIGTIIIVIAYFLTQARVIDSKHWAFPATNLIGAILIYYSLCYSFNLASVLMEIFWMGISFFGLVQYYREKRARCRRTTQEKERKISFGRGKQNKEM